MTEMPKQNNRRMFRLQITHLEHIALAHTVNENGKKSFRSWLIAELHRFYNNNKEIVDTLDQMSATRPPVSYHHIPSETDEFYVKLADFYKTDISKIVYRFIIQPAMINKTDGSHKAMTVLKLIKSEAELANAKTETSTPVFTQTPGVIYSIKEK